MLLNILLGARSQPPSGRFPLRQYLFNQLNTARTPAEIIERLNVEINAALADPTLRARLIDLGGTAIGGSPADFGRLIAADTEKWAKVVKFANIKPE